MEKMNMPQEIVKEFIVNVDGLNHTVRGRIVKDIEGDTNHLYMGHISHFCKPDDQAAEVYIPSLISEHYESVKSKLLDYLKTFTCLGIIKNDRY